MTCYFLCDKILHRAGHPASFFERQGYCMADIKQIVRDTIKNIHFTDGKDCDEYSEDFVRISGRGTIITLLQADSIYAPSAPFYWLDNQKHAMQYYYHTVVLVREQGVNYIVDLTSDPILYRFTDFVCLLKKHNNNKRFYWARISGIQAGAWCKPPQVLFGDKKAEVL